MHPIEEKIKALTNKKRSEWIVEKDNTNWLLSGVEVDPSKVVGRHFHLDYIFRKFYFLERRSL